MQEEEEWEEVKDPTEDDFNPGDIYDIHEERRTKGKLDIDIPDIERVS